MIVAVHIDHAITLVHVALGTQDIDQSPAKVANTADSVFKDSVFHSFYMVTVVRDPVVVLNPFFILRHVFTHTNAVFNREEGQTVTGGHVAHDHSKPKWVDRPAPLR